MSDYPRLYAVDLPAAIALWNAGKSTYQIAMQLRGSKVFEPAVANSLAAEREERRKAAAA